jgi:hypothetical protein
MNDFEWSKLYLFPWNLNIISTTKTAPFDSPAFAALAIIMNKVLESRLPSKN